MAKQLVVILMDMDPDILRESGLTQKQFEELPKTLVRELKKLAPKALEPWGVYYLSEKEKSKLEHVLEQHALDFDEVKLAFNGFGSVRHKQTCTVIRLDSHRKQ